jgi:hypothetical protein
MFRRIPILVCIVASCVLLGHPVARADNKNDAALRSMARMWHSKKV